MEIFSTCSAFIKPTTMCERNPVSLTTGVALTTSGILASSYLIYSRLCTPHPATINNVLSETLATVATGIFYLYWYSFCTGVPVGNMTDEVGVTRNTNQRPTCEETQDLWMHHAVLIAAVTHCFVSLVSDSFLCNKNIQEHEGTGEEIKERKQSNTNILLNTVRSPICGGVIGQWLIPALGVFCLYYIVYGNEICPGSTLTTIVDGFQSVVDELLEQSHNMVDNHTTTHKEEIKSIVDKVYTIVDSVSNSTEVTSVEEENLEIFNIIQKLNTLNVRTPKQIEPKIVYTTKFKVYMILLIILVYLVITYINVKYVKAKMVSGEISNENRNKKNLQRNVKYLKMLITAAVVLWTPSLTELFARIYIGENQPNIVSQILMATGTAYMLVRDGINLKLLKANMKTNNCVEPTA